MRWSFDETRSESCEKNADNQHASEGFSTKAAADEGCKYNVKRGKEGGSGWVDGVQTNHLRDEANKEDSPQEASSS